MLEAGLKVCINSDDPAYFGGYLGENLAAVQAEFGLDAAQLATLSANSIEASFLPSRTRSVGCSPLPDGRAGAARAHSAGWRYAKSLLTTGVRR